MKRYILLWGALLLLAILVFSFRAYAGEREELAAKLESKSLQMEMLKRDTMVMKFIDVATEANALKQKLTELDKKAKEKNEETSNN